MKPQIKTIKIEKVNQQIKLNATVKFFNDGEMICSIKPKDLGEIFIKDIDNSFKSEAQILKQNVISNTYINISVTLTLGTTYSSFVKQPVYFTIKLVDANGEKSTANRFNELKFTDLLDLNT